MAKVRPNKSLGQNFLRDESVVADIVAGAELSPEDLVIEVGPGTGALSRQIAEGCGKLVAVEIDDHVIPHLEKALSGRDNAEILHEDFLEVDLAALVKGEMEENPGLTKAKLIGNLPYYITTPIIMKVLNSGAPVNTLVLMMQKEVADRIHAHPGTKEYGALTVAVGYHCTTERIVDVDRSCFWPVPKVDSCVLKLSMREEKAAAPKDEKLFFACVKAGFAKRRKTLLNCLTGMNGLDKEQVAEVFHRVGIDENRRGETLTIEEFAKLADGFTDAQTKV